MGRADARHLALGARRRGGRRRDPAQRGAGGRAGGDGGRRAAGARRRERRRRGVAGPQQPGRGRPDPGLLAHRCRRCARPAFVRRRGRRGGPRSDRPGARRRARARRVLRPRRALRGPRRRSCARRCLAQPPLRCGPGALHLRFHRDPQGGAAHAARPELEGDADGARARTRVGRRRPHAGADGSHLGTAQRGPGPRRGRPALGPGPPLRPRAGAGAGGARAHLVPGGPADLLHRDGTRPGRRTRRGRVVGAARVQRRCLGHAGVRGGHGAHLRLPRQADLRLDRGADRHHQHR